MKYKRAANLICGAINRGGFLMNQETLVNSLIKVDSRGLNILKNILLVVSGVIFLALFSQIRISIEPVSPVPITGQTFAVALIGFLYGKRLGAATLIAYIVAGSLGMPVYTGAKSGFVLFAANGGYIIGFFLMAIICGHFAEKGYTKSAAKTLAVLFLAHAVMYFFGLMQLSHFIKGKNVFMAGLVPFIAGDIIKMILVANVLPLAWKLLGKNEK